MKVRIQDTVEFHKDEVRVLKRLAEEHGYANWRNFVRGYICSNGKADLDNELSYRMD